ncbi:cytochrome b561 [Loktanella ponticola]|uniref:Cytochrome b561 n=1 Tax=Yoonia ponticola TaxID=1524255 RepID=A0A7W9BKP6_9RHOB|nr:cytochrome b [Yoonia ponticola]MBB5722087.1 cytochrome b561 [Yoonia ponticola]
MTKLSDTPNRFGLVSRIFHWGMAALFAMQFLSAAAHWALPRENALRETLWSYHTNLGATLFMLVLLRGIWGLLNMKNRPAHVGGVMGKAAKFGQAGLYAFMIIVPAVRLLAAFGSKRGFSYFGMQVFPPRETAIAWTQAAAEWHGEMGWILVALVLGHIAMAIVWHRLIQRDDVLKRMA